MRYLHPVAASEKFIARGVYHYSDGEALFDIKEEWTRHAVAGGGILTRVDQERKYRTTLMEVLVDEVGKIERLHIREWNREIDSRESLPKQFIASSNMSHRTLRADYIFFPDYVQASCRFDDENTINQEIAFPTPLDAVDLTGITFVYVGEQIPLISKFHVENKPMTTFAPTLSGESLGKYIQAIPPYGDPVFNESLPSERAYNFNDYVIVLNQNGFMARMVDVQYNNTVIVLTEYAHI